MEDAVQSEAILFNAALMGNYDFLNNQARIAENNLVKMLSHAVFVTLILMLLLTLTKLMPWRTLSRFCTVSPPVPIISQDMKRCNQTKSEVKNMGSGKERTTINFDAETYRKILALRAEPKYARMSISAIVNMLLERALADITDQTA